MKHSAQKIKATTQKFTEIEDIVGNIVLLSGGNACLLIQVSPINFSLLSDEEKYAKLYSYGSLLNSLSFPIQILIRNKKIDISSYLRLLEMEQKKTKNQALSEKIKQYKDFATSIVKINTVLDKKFYIVIPYSYLETTATKGSKNSFLESAKNALKMKSESLHVQLKRLGLFAKTLNKEDTVGLFHDFYNSEHSQPILHLSESDQIALPVVDVIAPSSVETDFNYIRVGEKFYKTFFAVGYPRFVSANWMSPLIDFNHSLNISMFIYPREMSSILSDLKRKIGELEALSLIHI